jgi:hypothetical protein
VQTKESLERLEGMSMSGATNLAKFEKKLTDRTEGLEAMLMQAAMNTSKFEKKIDGRTEGWEPAAVHLVPRAPITRGSGSVLLLRAAACCCCCVQDGVHASGWRSPELQDDQHAERDDRRRGGDPRTGPRNGCAPLQLPWPHLDIRTHTCVHLSALVRWWRL